jgi:hypothetical protein
VATEAAAENGISAVVVPDPECQISLAYGVNIWPTTIFLDAFGLARSIRYGRFAGELTRYGAPAKIVSSLARG